MFSQLDHHHDCQQSTSLLPMLGTRHQHSPNPAPLEAESRLSAVQSVALWPQVGPGLDLRARAKGQRRPGPRAASSLQLPPPTSPFHLQSSIFYIINLLSSHTVCLCLAARTIAIAPALPHPSSRTVAITLHRCHCLLLSRPVHHLALILTHIIAIALLLATLIHPHSPSSHLRHRLPLTLLALPSPRLCLTARTITITITVTPALTLTCCSSPSPPPSLTLVLPSPCTLTPSSSFHTALVLHPPSPCPSPCPSSRTIASLTRRCPHFAPTLASECRPCLTPLPASLAVAHPRVTIASLLAPALVSLSPCHRHCPRLTPPSSRCHLIEYLLYRGPGPEKVGPSPKSQGHGQQNSLLKKGPIPPPPSLANPFLLNEKPTAKSKDSTQPPASLLVVEQTAHLESLLDSVLATLVIIQAAVTMPIALSNHTCESLSVLDKIAHTSASNHALPTSPPVQEDNQRSHM
ncbi:unnamed protein product [Cyclocybe aegerita]|uniref:Uncharacterized protein n=1 Tax=Cyclocybe aegerita TaxID=1973307 RepID=A0A8S0VQ18_CYCAE|nr:unnamed protein product [Cyclocybe aegerita]